jgi:DNA-binding PadR family transcriptional regulator
MHWSLDDVPMNGHITYSKNRRNTILIRQSNSSLTKAEYLATISLSDISQDDTMTNSTPQPGQFYPLTPAVFNVLLALADGEKHGYAIMQAINQRSGGGTRLGPGTLYGIIKRMLVDGWIEELDERPDPTLDDERRRYYRLTDLGQRVASAEAERMAQLVLAARKHGLLPDMRGAG